MLSITRIEKKKTLRHRVSSDGGKYLTGAAVWLEHGHGIDDFSERRKQSGRENNSSNLRPEKSHIGGAQTSATITMEMESSVGVAWIFDAIIKSFMHL